MFSAGVILDGGPNFSGGGGGGGGLWWWVAAAPPSRAAVAVTALAGIAVFAALFYTTNRGHIKSPWSRRKRKGALSPQQWKSMFAPDGKLHDGGVKLLKRVRSGGVDPSIRPEVWPFLLGVYCLSSTKEERQAVRTQKRKEYEKLRRQCQRLLKHEDVDSGNTLQDTVSSNNEGVVSAKESGTKGGRKSEVEYSDDSSSTLVEGDKGPVRSALSDDCAVSSDSSKSYSCGEPEVIQASFTCEHDHNPQEEDSSCPSGIQTPLNRRTSENFGTWKRIIRVDAIRANAEWVPFSPSQASLSESKAQHLAEAVGLKDYDHLEPCRIFHAARLVAILEAYAAYDPEIGYCQGMSDLLSPIIAVITEDDEAFWCFVGFMKKARHNFRLDEIGIRRQLGIVAKIIKFKDAHLFKHLEELQAEDCFFVYRMVVVLFRRELTFEQTLCLWEVIWADQTAIRSGIGKSAWGRIKLRAPPTEDLLLYAIAASVLQKRKLIIEKYSSMDEILRECNSMAGHLDVWKLLDDAHGLVVNLHDKIEEPWQ